MDPIDKITVGILTVSDRCYAGLREDDSGPVLFEAVRKRGWAPLQRALVSDDRPLISSILLKWCDELKLDLILTTGGTGLGPRDQTPETTKLYLDKELPGLSELMRLEGRRHTPMAVLSRGVCGTRRKTVVINLPGSPQGAVQSFEAVAEVIPHALHMLKGDDHQLKEPLEHALPR